MMVQSALVAAPRKFTLSKPKAKRLRKSNPWTGVCCESCWNALEERCVCRCGGAHHGEGLKGKDQRLDEEQVAL